MMDQKLLGSRSVGQLVFFWDGMMDQKRGSSLINISSLIFSWSYWRGRADILERIVRGSRVFRSGR